MAATEVPDPRNANEAGYSLSYVTGAVYSLLHTKEAGYSLSEMPKADYLLSSANEAGYSLSNANEAVHSLLYTKEAGYSLSEMPKADYLLPNANEVGMFVLWHVCSSGSWLTALPTVGPRTPATRAWSRQRVWSFSSMAIRLLALLRSSYSQSPRAWTQSRPRRRRWGSSIRP